MSHVDTVWFMELGWGVYFHFLGEIGQSAEVWNERIDAFDAEGLARQVASVGAGYLFVTVGQCSGHYMAPNETYDRLTGIRPSKCSRRDLVDDLYHALNQYGIRLFTYIACEGPAKDPAAIAALGGPPHWSQEPGFSYPDNSDPHWARYRCPDYYARWETVLAEWSQRWGTKTNGWWVDGAYGKNHRFPEEDSANLGTFKAALRAGNPHAIVAFNPGLEKRLIGYTPHCDFTAGEFAWSLPEIPGPMVSCQGKEIQSHVLTYMGDRWGGPIPRFSDDLVVAYTQHVISRGGVISWDVGVNERGLITESNMRQLKQLKGLRGLAAVTREKNNAPDSVGCRSNC